MADHNVVPTPTAQLAPAIRRGFVAGLLLACAAGLFAADTPPQVGPGNTRDEVISAYGPPKGQSHLGAKEILRYPQGTVTLLSGRVERVDFSAAGPRPAPRSRPTLEAPPKPATPEPAPAAPEVVNPWVTDVPSALAQAAKKTA
jgi:hypothetical protein